MAYYHSVGFPLPQKLVDKIVKHAQQESAKNAESVGVIYQNKYVKLKNIAKNKADQFELSDLDVLKYEQMDALVHSHLNQIPFLSTADFIAQQNLNVDFLLVVDQEIKHFRNIKPLIGREFNHGITDCYTLVRDVYHIAGIELPDFERTDNWWQRDEQLYLTNIESVGFSQVTDIQIGDIILINLGAKEPCHAMIYIGDNMVLHHPPNRLSKRDLYDGYWLKYTHSIWRHKEWQPSNFTAILNNMATSSL